MRIRDFLRTGGAALTAAWWIAGAAAAPSAQPNQAPPELWLAPSGASDASQSPLALAVANLNAGKAAAAEPVFAKATSDPVLGGYARLYLGRAQLAAGRPADASSSAQVLLRSVPLGRLNEAALWLAADGAEEARDWPAAIRALQALTGSTIPSPERAWFRLGKAAVSAENRQLALQAFAKVYYEFALTETAADAADEMKKLVASPFLPTPESYPLDLGRAAAALRRAALRRRAEGLRAVARARARRPDRSSISLRSPSATFHLKRYAAARDALRAYLDEQDRPRRRGPVLLPRDDARARTGDDVRRAGRRRSSTPPGRALAEDALNDLGTLLHPRGRRREGRRGVRRAAPALPDRARSPIARRGRPAGGRTSNGDYAETIRMFETAAVTHAARGLPAVVALLGRARAQQPRRSATRRSPAIATSSPTIAIRTTAAQAAR